MGRPVSLGVLRDVVMAKGACVGTYADEFFPKKHDDTAGVTRKAKGYCRICPVTVECLEWALATGQPTGVWGGLSPKERRAMIK
jgi:WhiB family redox-sensing transcriptional regulator